MTGADIYTRAVELAQLRNKLLGISARYATEGRHPEARKYKRHARACEASIRELALKSEIQLARWEVIRAERLADQQQAAGAPA